MSRPWMKFYPTDWRADPALRMCSIAARGLWMEMLCVMHEANPRGWLLVNGNTMNERQIASLVGASLDEVKDCLAELEHAGVFSRDDNGTIYSRRMERDEAKAAKDKANGSLGGNPDLKPGVNPHDKAQKPDNQRLEEDSSSPSEAQVPRDSDIPIVRRDQASPADPVLQRPDDPLAEYSDAEIKALTFEFDGLDVESAIHDLSHWAWKKGIRDPIERKSAIYGAMKKRHGAAKLHDAMTEPIAAQASPQLVASLAKRGRSPPHRQTAERLRRG